MTLLNLKQSAPLIGIGYSTLRKWIREKRIVFISLDKPYLTRELIEQIKKDHMVRYNDEGKLEKVSC